MGYELYITRKENWFDENEQENISLKEWIDYLSTDSEMRLDNFAQIELPNNEQLRIDKEGLAVWLKYSGEGMGQNHAWFTYYDGNIQVKNPDQEIINKMIDIAISLNAKVQGEQGEPYEKRPYLDRNLKEIDSYNIGRKPWWKFW